MNFEIRRNGLFDHSPFPGQSLIIKPLRRESRSYLSPFVGLLAIVFFFGCQGGRYENEATQDLSRAEKIHYEQYMVQGQQLYRTHCSNCHQEEGTGLGKLIPPLAQSDYLLADVDRTLCLIKYGLQGEIIVNDQSYQQPMPANEALRDIEIAQIATYIYNHWGHAKGYIPVKQVSNSLDQCAADSSTYSRSLAK